MSELTLPPANRKPVVTACAEDRSSAACASVVTSTTGARRVVCPLIEESETKVARAAEAEAERLRSAELRGYRVGCLHGRLPPGERRSIMASFKAGELDVLVATTVIEVGVDVPNATIMIVQEADRFGLAQLHQLRGRVGRGAEQSYRLLVSRAKEELTEGASERLEAMVATTDGFELAERDLEIRGGPAPRRAPVRLLGSPFRPSSSRPGFARSGPRRSRASFEDDGPARRLGVDRPIGRESEHLGSTAARIVAGSRKGHRIEAPKGIVTRPTGDRVREAAFSLIGPIEGAAVLDLFAGSGAMGLEAFSRGASRCVFVERDRAACRVIQANLEKLHLNGAIVLNRDAGSLRDERARP